MQDWYVLHVYTGKENDVVNVLSRQLLQCKSMVPRRLLRERKNGIWQNKIRNLFPGYVFIYTDINVAMYYKLTALPYVIKILGNDRGPQPVPADEINPILRWHGSGDPLGISGMYVEGGYIPVIDGPLQGMEGQIIKVDARRQRAKVNISLMGQPRVVELAVKMITKSEPESC
jgi:transcriptional antiterminator NusG